MPSNRIITLPNQWQDSNCSGFYHRPVLDIGGILIGGCSPTPDLSHESTDNIEIFCGRFECGYRLRVSDQKYFVFDFNVQMDTPVTNTPSPDIHKEMEEVVFSRTRFMNLFLSCFYTSMLRLQGITCLKMFVDYTTHMGCIKFDEIHWEVPTETTDPIEVFRNILSESVKMVDIAVRKKSENIEILSELLLHAFYLLESGKYEASHTGAWTVAEKCLNMLWKEHLRSVDNSNEKTDEVFINKDRLDRLTGRDFTVSIISEILSLLNIISVDEYKKITSVRQARDNKWLHEMKRVHREDSVASINLAQLMLRKTNLLDVEIPCNIVRGIPIRFVPPVST